MFYGALSPYLQRMQGQQGQTPGSGLPPYANAPMNMQTPQMPTPNVVQSQGPPVQQPGQGQQPMNPAQMGMLSQMLAQKTQQPTPGQAGAAAGAVGTGGMVPPQMVGEQPPQQGGGMDLQGLLRMLPFMQGRRR